ncbi:MAG TPA: sulfatase-like hydrolase/transferase [Acidimicrobiales bacterium]|jgi:arylsulfatase A-like enzyme|nr:sulfatase-like hydrolase/transferase [Acidimicrobiales bacterium]
MASQRNVLFITVDQWRGDSLSALGHPIVQTPTLDGLAQRGVLFANHWANAAPCGPSRACLYTGTYQHRNRSVANGTPLDARFTNVAMIARELGYDPVLFGYTDTSVDPRTVAADDPRLRTYEGILPGFREVIRDPWEEGSPEWGKWLTGHGIDVPTNPHALYDPIPDFPGADTHGATWAPSQFPSELSQTTFVRQAVTDWLTRHGDQPFFVHASFIRPHPPRRNPIGYHDLYDAEQIPRFVGCERREDEAALHPLAGLTMSMPGVGAPDEDRDRRQLRATYYGAQREVDDGLSHLFEYLHTSGLADTTMVILTSDHGEMGGDHWLLEKLGYWDESYHVPMIVVDPRPSADGARGRVVDAFTESVDILPTLCDFLGAEVPLQADGWSLAPFLRGDVTPPHWRETAHFEWDFSNPSTQAAETFFDIPMSHCSLAVSRGSRYKYVQFAASSDLFPPLLFDLGEDPDQVRNLCAEPGSDWKDLAWAGTQELLQWRMRTAERTLSGHFLSPETGLVTARDTWR